MQTRRPGLADRLKDFLDQLELVRGERVVLDEILGILEWLEGHPAVLESQLVLEDVALSLSKVSSSSSFTSSALCEQTGLDHLIDVGAGERQAGLETPLNLGEVVRLRLPHLAEHGVDVLLGCDDDPGPAAADRAEFLGDRLEIEHQMRVGADELADFIDQEEQSVVRPLGVEILLDPFAEVLDREGETALPPRRSTSRGIWALAERLGEGLDHLIPVEMVGVTLLDPLVPGGLAEGIVELPASFPLPSR